jgi:RNA polymerase sigma factor (sigma-70 family)
MGGKQKTIRQLIKGIRLGNKSDEKEFFTIYSDKWDYLLGQWGTPKQEKADILQDTFVAVIKGIINRTRRRKAIRNLESYMIQILRNKRSDHLKKSANNPDLNRKYIRLSEINAEIKRQRKSINSSQFEHTTEIIKKELSSKLTQLLEERDQVIDSIRDLSRSIRQTLTKEESLQRKDPAPNPTDLLDRNEVRRLVLDVLRDEFSDRERHLIFDRLYREATYPELSNQYGISAASARNRYKNFIKFMAKKIRKN